MIPVNIVTGFLGSGKTTLLREVLGRPEYADTAVIVNEFGEIGLDHFLLEEVEEGILLLQSGCICCTIRSDLQETIRSLQKRAGDGLIPKFRRLIIETTGIADPAPIVSTISSDPLISKHFYLANIVCTVDGLSGASSLASAPEAFKQAAVADRILVTKSDLTEIDILVKIEKTLRHLNPTASIQRSSGAEFDTKHLFSQDVFVSNAEAEDVLTKLDRHLKGSASIQDPLKILHDISSFSLEFPGSIDWIAFGVWLTATLHVHGENILRVKGILNTRESAEPVFINGVQHTMHPPIHMDRWPNGERTSRIIFITRGIKKDIVQRSLHAFLSAADKEYRQNELADLTTFRT
ncbi:GTP-binding protein [Sneathiella marina]|uniref:GTP-binding protein n=1 Tax=Sneathiella marina TaxID=2950108 RepID=A0ABY4W8L3_9PROT|nr:GTP-binding protein [Sneathiella marina]USG61609.1 GTP-binding protein [Sneathiella marina]